MDAASDGNYRLNVGFQYPGQAFYSEAGKETYNIKNQELAKKYLAQSGYKGEPVILLTDKDYPAMYNSSLVMQQQMQAIGINAQLKVVDWPTSANMALKSDTGWNFFYTGWGTKNVAPTCRTKGTSRKSSQNAVSCPSFACPCQHQDGVSTTSPGVISTRLPSTTV